MSRRRSRKPGTSRTTSYRPAICISDYDIQWQITHRKPTIEEACCLVNIGCKWIISLVPVGLRGSLLTSIRERFDDAFFKTQVLREIVSESEVYEVVPNWKGRPKFWRRDYFRGWLIVVSPDYARRYFPVVIDQNIFVCDILMHNKQWAQ